MHWTGAVQRLTWDVMLDSEGESTSTEELECIAERIGPRDSCRPRGRVLIDALASSKRSASGIGSAGRLFWKATGASHSTACRWNCMRKSFATRLNFRSVAFVSRRTC